jgi:long-chain acyl-CoA synthetase
MSESTGVISWEAVRPRPGTVGRPLDELEVVIADDGEILVRGPVVFPGYLDDPDTTAEVLEDGWLHTGDIGAIDEDGYLRIVDRKKEIIITAGGENVSPGNLEAALKTLPLVGDVCVVGDRQRFPAALVTLDPDKTLPWAKEHGLADRTLPELASEPAVHEEIQRGFDAVNRHFTRAYQVKRFTVLPDQWQADRELMTPTFKLKRRGIAARYAEEIAALYAGT